MPADLEGECHESANDARTSKGRTGQVGAADVHFAHGEPWRVFVHEEDAHAVLAWSARHHRCDENVGVHAHAVKVGRQSDGDE